MTRCILNGGDSDTAMLELDDPGDNIERGGQVYRRMRDHAGQPSSDITGAWRYQWVYPRSVTSSNSYREAP